MGGCGFGINHEKEINVPNFHKTAEIIILITMYPLTSWSIKRQCLVLLSLLATNHGENAKIKYVILVGVKARPQHIITVKSSLGRDDLWLKWYRGAHQTLLHFLNVLYLIEYTVAVEHFLKYRTGKMANTNS